MKILAIIGTPTAQDGYTTQSVQALEKAFRGRRDVEFEYIYLAEVQLSGCQGRLTCVKFGEHKCPYVSELAPLLQAMHSADVVIFGSPVHCFNVSTLMKNFIDLLVYQMHRPAFLGQKAIVVATAAGAGQKGVVKYLRKTVANWGFDVVGQLGTHAGFFGEPKYQTKLERAAGKVVDQTISAVDRAELPKPGLAELINFRVWRSTVIRTENASPYDWEYWQNAGWLKQDYYYKVKTNPIAGGLAGLVEKLIARAIRKVSVSPST